MDAHLWLLGIFAHHKTSFDPWLVTQRPLYPIVSPRVVRWRSIVMGYLVASVKWQKPNRYQGTVIKSRSRCLPSSTSRSTAKWLDNQGFRATTNFTTGTALQQTSSDRFIQFPLGPFYGSLDQGKRFIFLTVPWPWLVVKRFWAFAGVTNERSFLAGAHVWETMRACFLGLRIPGDTLDEPGGWRTGSPRSMATIISTREALIEQFVICHIDLSASFGSTGSR